MEKYKENYLWTNWADDLKKYNPLGTLGSLDTLRLRVKLFCTGELLLYNLITYHLPLCK